MSWKTIAAAAIFGLGFAGSAQSFEIGEMSEAERELFREEVRAYLMERPEVLLEAITILEERQAAANAMSDADLIAANAEEIFNDGHSAVAGNPDGDVTIVEFIDYRCGFCRKAHPEVAELLSRDGNIKLIYKEFPILGEESVLASRFAISVQKIAGDAVYKSVSDALMTQNGRYTEGSLRRIANQHGLDFAEVEAGMDSSEVDQALSANYQLAQTMRINGTPAFILDGELVRGYVPVAAMRDAVARVRGN